MPFQSRSNLLPPAVRLELGARLVEQPERNLGIVVPIPISERVEELAQLLYDEGYGRVSRKEVVGALLLAATEDPSELADLLRNYRNASVRDSLVGQAATGQAASFPLRPPGPRPRPS